MCVCSILGTGVTDGRCEPPCGCGKWDQSSSGRAAELLTTEMSLQLLGLQYTLSHRHSALGYERPEREHDRNEKARAIRLSSKCVGLASAGCSGCGHGRVVIYSSDCTMPVSPLHSLFPLNAWRTGPFFLSMHGFAFP